jgi:hypothetical protein
VILKERAIAKLKFVIEVPLNIVLALGGAP